MVGKGNKESENLLACIAKIQGIPFLGVKHSRRRLSAKKYVQKNYTHSPYFLCESQIHCLSAPVSTDESCVKAGQFVAGLVPILSWAISEVYQMNWNS